MLLKALLESVLGSYWLFGSSKDLPFNPRTCSPHSGILLIDAEIRSKFNDFRILCSFEILGNSFIELWESEILRLSVPSAISQWNTLICKFFQLGTMLMIHASWSMNNDVVSNGSWSVGWKKLTGHTSMYFRFEFLKKQTYTCDHIIMRKQMFFFVKSFYSLC